MFVEDDADPHRLEEIGGKSGAVPGGMARAEAPRLPTLRQEAIAG